MLPSQFFQKIYVWTHLLKIVLQLGGRITQRDPALHNAFISLTFSSTEVMLCTNRFNIKKPLHIAGTESSVFQFAIQKCKD